MKNIPAIITTEAIHLVGLMQKMSFAENKNKQLWKDFLPYLSIIKHRKGHLLFSVEEFEDVAFFQNFNPHTEFKKWAAVAVSKIADVPQVLQTLMVPEGMYAVFQYKGHPEAAQPFFQYIYSEWLPKSEYRMDDRPHLCVMGEKYNNDSPNSEEEIWIPIKK